MANCGCGEYDMDSAFLVIVLIAFFSLALFLGSSASGRMMTARKTIAGCGAVFFAAYGVLVPEARTESLIMTTLAVVIFYYLTRVSSVDQARE